MTQANDILKRNGKSFHFASLALDRETAERCARLYAFCRYVDDLADETNDEAAARARLMHIVEALQGADTTDAAVLDFIELARMMEMPVQPAIDLVYGVLFDLGRVRIESVGELHRYCYRVAGTVGLLMCGVLGVRDPRARPFAIDLGIAMQLTNIARDVLEDAEAGRRYIPASIIGDVSPAVLSRAEGATRQQIEDAVCWLLGEADRYYHSGEAGLVFLPARAQFAIRIASRVYHRIGVRLQRRGYAAWRGRTVVPVVEKLLVAVKAVAAHWKARRQSVPRHTGLLHRWLQQTTSIS